MSAAAPQRDLGDLREEVLAQFDRAPVLSYGLGHLAALWGQMALVIALLQVRPEGLLWGALFFAWMGWTQYRQYFVLHEACHQALLPGAVANRWAGRLTAALLFTSFRSFTSVHMEHHRLWGKREDPGAVDYFVRFRTRGETLRFFLRPLLGLSVLEEIWTNVARPLLRGRAREARPGEASIEPVDVLCVAGVQGVVFLAITGLGARPFDYLLFYVLPEITIFLFLARLRMYLEHGPLDYAVSDYLGESPRRIARTHDSPWLESPFFQYMHFRYHREHHLFPSMPSVHLPEIHRRFTRERLHPDDLAPSYLSSLRHIARLADTPPLPHPVSPVPPPRLSLVIPAYNEAQRLGEPLRRAGEYLASRPYTSEIVVVDDGSSDDTARVARETGAKLEVPVTVVRYATNRGKGFALKVGFARARGERILFSDADLSTPIEETDRLLEKLEEGHDIAIGSRWLPGAEVRRYQPWYRIALGSVFTLLVRLLLARVSDATCGFKAFRGDAGRDVFSRSRIARWSFDAEILHVAQRLRLRVAEVPVAWSDVRGTKVSLGRDTVESLLGLLRIRWNAGRGLYDRPLPPDAELEVWSSAAESGP